MNSDSRMTKNEGLALHGVHHYGAARTISEVAASMGVSRSTVRRLLKSAEKKSPGIFPVLTATQAKVLHLYTVEGASTSQIAMMRGVSIGAIRKTLRKLREIGVLKDKPSLSRTVSFNEVTMSDKVVSKW